MTRKESSRAVLDIDCACVGDCTIFRIQRWEDDPEFYGEMYVLPYPWSWGARLRHAWNALSGRYSNVPAPVLMEPEARRLGEWLIEQTTTALESASSDKGELAPSSSGGPANPSTADNGPSAFKTLSAPTRTPRCGPWTERDDGSFECQKCGDIDYPGSGPMGF